MYILQSMENKIWEREYYAGIGGWPWSRSIVYLPMEALTSDPTERADINIKMKETAVIARCLAEGP